VHQPAYPWKSHICSFRYLITFVSGTLSLASVSPSATSFSHMAVFLFLLHSHLLSLIPLHPKALPVYSTNPSQHRLFSIHWTDVTHSGHVPEYLLIVLWQHHILLKFFLYSFLQRVRTARNADRCNSDGLSVCLSVCLFVCLSVCPSVGCLSVHPSRSGVLPKRMNIRSCGLQHQVDNHSSFWRGTVYPDIRGGSPPARALKWGNVASENLTNSRS